MCRTVSISLFLIIQTLAVYFSPVAYAVDAGTLVSQLPRAFAGQFQWRDSIRIYKVTLDFKDVQVLDDGRVEATGSGVYDAYGEINKVNVRAVIDPDDLYLEMWEYDPANKGSELEGVYRGDLSDDMQTITAMWRDFADRKARGYLDLKAKQEN